MIKTIRTQALRLAFTYCMLAGLVVWQREFIISGILAHVQLNLIIIGVFIFGSVISVFTLLNLRNDITAYNALRSVYEDEQARRYEPLNEAELRRRCLKPGIVFRSSQLLGPVFDLTLEELLRSRQMRISVATMQNLISAIDGRIAHQRSLNTYLTNLCIFLGLIGTFIGLMEMVGSVGGIIGGLANSDAGSSDTMRTLIKNLEAPLTGMASGFSASLFGLFGSLMLGLSGRFTSIATHSIREEFEGWLAGISQIESDAAAAGGQGANVAGLSPLLQRIGSALRANTERIEQQIEVVERASRQLDRAARTEQQALMALSRVDHLQAEMSRLREDQSAGFNALRLSVLDAFERLSRGAREQSSLALSEISKIASLQSQTSGALAQLADANEKFAAATADQYRAVRADLGKAVDGQAAHASVLSQVAAAQQRLASGIEDQRAAHSADMLAVKASLDRTSRIAEERLGAATEELSSMSVAQSQAHAALTQVSAVQSRIVHSVEEQREMVLAEMARLNARQATAETAIAALGAAQERALRSGDEKQNAAAAELTRLASVQDYGNSLLVKIAAAQAASPEQGTLAATVADQVGAAVAQLAQAMDQSIRAISNEVTKLAEAQQRTVAAVAAAQAPEDLFKREISDLGRVLQSGINAGMLDVAQTLESTLAAQTEALRDLAERRGPVEAANAAPHSHLS